MFGSKKKHIVGITQYNVVSRMSAKFRKSTDYNLIAMVGICMYFSSAISQGILIFHYPLW